ncbi:MAG: hypothetical protein V4649_12725 [Bacteroidota bacterium]
MKKKSYFLFCLVAISSCDQTNISMDKLEWVDELYLVNERPYTGVVFNKFEDGNISGTITIKNGIPNGGWKALGFDREIVQEGNYQPVEIYKFSHPNIRRLNLVFGKEGPYNSWDLFIVVKDSDKINFDTPFIKSQIQKNYHVDSITLNIVLGELELEGKSK